MKAFIETNRRNPSRHNPEEQFKCCNRLKPSEQTAECGGVETGEHQAPKDSLGLKVAIWDDAIVSPAEERYLPLVAGQLAPQDAECLGARYRDAYS